ncbi:hypothetical protein JCM13304A_09700 [Desulfothermus okinawensis JCM 13304]
MKTKELIEKIEKYPRKYRIIAFFVLIAIMLTSYWYFVFKPKNEQINYLMRDIENLNRLIVINRKKISRLKKLEVEVKDKQRIFYYAKKLLPDSTVEIENLLANIETLGNDVGVEFLLFQPGQEVVADFYAKRRLTLKIMGYFPNLMLFFSHISNLNRLVTLDSVSFRPQRNQMVTANCKLYIYRSLTEKELQARQKNKRKRRKR